MVACIFRNIIIASKYHASYRPRERAILRPPLQESCCSSCLQLSVKMESLSTEKETPPHWGRQTNAVPLPCGTCRIDTPVPSRLDTGLYLMTAGQRQWTLLVPWTSWCRFSPHNRIIQWKRWLYFAAVSDLLPCACPHTLRCPWNLEMLSLKCNAFLLEGDREISKVGFCFERACSFVPLSLFYHVMISFYCSKSLFILLDWDGLLVSD